jgi:hypothetical protein
MGSTLKKRWNRGLKKKATGAFNWAKWFAGKVIHYAGALLGFCARAIANKFPALTKVTKFLGVATPPTPVASPTAALKLIVQTTFPTEKVTSQSFRLPFIFGQE